MKIQLLPTRQQRKEKGDSVLDVDQKKGCLIHRRPNPSSNKDREQGQSHNQKENLMIILNNAK